jgi:NAD(P)-dependent dehydrogenase (short-subunit alcohol dehydrogenase family)
MRGLKHKVAILTGVALGNIGGAIAIRLAESDAGITAADRNESAARAVILASRESV